MSYASVHTIKPNKGKWTPKRVVSVSAFGIFLVVALYLIASYAIGQNASSRDRDVLYAVAARFEKDRGRKMDIQNRTVPASHITESVLQNKNLPHPIPFLVKVSALMRGFTRTHLGELGAAGPYRLVRGAEPDVLGVEDFNAGRSDDSGLIQSSLPIYQFGGRQAYVQFRVLSGRENEVYVACMEESDSSWKVHWISSVEKYQLVN